MEAPEFSVSPIIAERAVGPSRFRAPGRRKEVGAVPTLARHYERGERPQCSAGGLKPRCGADCASSLDKVSISTAWAKCPRYNRSCPAVDRIASIQRHAPSQRELAEGGCGPCVVYAGERPWRVFIVAALGDLNPGEINPVPLVCSVRYPGIERAYQVPGAAPIANLACGVIMLLVF